MLKIIIVVLAVSVLYAVVYAYGSARWKSETHELRERLHLARSAVEQNLINFDELEGLPAPVKRYCHAVLEDGGPIVTEVHVQHAGTFNVGEASSRWKRFTSEQWMVTSRPGFAWNGIIEMLPGLPVRVHDAYVAGEGILHASLLGLVSVVNLRGKGDLARGELMRYLAEATWYPTALLPGQGVEWEEVDDRSAFALLADGDTRISLLFTFNEQGLVETVSAEARGRTVAGEVVQTPWRGRYWNYENRSGMLVPTDGEVAWVMPEGENPYWRGRIVELDYEFAGRERDPLSRPSS